MILNDMWMPYGRKPFPEEIRISPKRCGMTHKQWEKKKRERKKQKESKKALEKMKGEEK